MHVFYGDFEQISVHKFLLKRNTWKFYYSLFHQFVIESSFYNKKSLLQQKSHYYCYYKKVTVAELWQRFPIKVNGQSKLLDCVK